MSAGKLREPRVITDFRQRLECVLPVGFYLNDELWEKIFDRFEHKGDSLSMADLKTLFPDEETVQSPADETGKMFNHKRTGK